MCPRPPPTREVLKNKPNWAQVPEQWVPQPFLAGSETWRGTTQQGCDHHLIGWRNTKQWDWAWHVHWGHLCFFSDGKKVTVCQPARHLLGPASIDASSAHPGGSGHPAPLCPWSAGPSLSISLPVTSARHREGLARSRPWRQHSPTASPMSQKGIRGWPGEQPGPLSPTELFPTPEVLVVQSLSCV